MPFATLKSVYAVNNEDPRYPASNLLKIESSKKWRTSSNEKSAYVTIQLEKELKITGIDIGNEHSAFVEVLVGKTRKNDDFKEILLTSSFMTPIESKNSDNRNRVRCFSKDKLIESVAEEKWDLVKFVCTQPFNKHCHYGLSFIKIHVAESRENKPIVPENFLHKNTLNNDEKSANNVAKFLGKFKLREESPDSESESTTALFNRWKHQSRTPENTNKILLGSTAAAIREASTPNALKYSSECLKPAKIIKKVDTKPLDVDAFDKKTVLDRNRSDLLYNENDDKPNDKFERRISLDQERIGKEREKQKERKLKEKPNKEISSKKKSDSSIGVQKMDKESSFSSKFKNFLEDDDGDEVQNVNSSAKKRLSSSINNNKPAKRIRTEKDLDYKPFNKLLEGVVLTISGIQNPNRADIRSKSLAMGAKYKPDWDHHCTHLICAFKNTPKYLQVQEANGKIVTSKWIETCYKTKKRLPWRRYALDKSEIDKKESEEEILDITMKPLSPQPSVMQSYTVEPSTSSEKHSSPKSTNNQHELNDNILARYDLGFNDDLKDDKYHILSSGSDTEEEIEKVQQKQKVKNGEKSTIQNIYNNIEEKKVDDKNISETLPEEDKLTKEKEKLQDIFDVSTEEEEFTKKRHQQKEPKQFFRNKKFYLTSKLSAIDKTKLKGIIEQYDGELIESLRQANYIISKEELEISNIHGAVVSPLWVYECNDMECLIPTKRYLI